MAKKPRGPNKLRGTRYSVFKDRMARDQLPGPPKPRPERRGYTLPRWPGQLLEKNFQIYREKLTEGWTKVAVAKFIIREYPEFGEFYHNRTGRIITPNVLVQRYDKANRYSEHERWKERW